MTFDDDSSSDPVEAWQFAVGPWHPHPLSRPDPAMTRGRRWILLSLIAVGHVLVFWMLEYSSRGVLLDVPDTTTTLVFLVPDVVEPEPAVPVTVPAPVESLAPAVVPPPAAPAVPTPRAEPPAEPREPRVLSPMVAVEPPLRAGEPLRLYEPDGSLALPADVIARIDEVDGDQRVFDFQRPGLMESGRLMTRQPVLVYEPTRFDRYWIPEKDILTQVLEKAVEATTGTVEIPIPGSPGSKLVCTVSILAMGGGCGIRNAADGYVVQLDDPDTLNPEEDAQCRAWWEQIVAAGDQDTWRRTRDLYEFNCRKPLEKVEAVPD